MVHKELIVGFMRAEKNYLKKFNLFIFNKKYIIMHNIKKFLFIAPMVLAFDCLASYNQINQDDLSCQLLTKRVPIRLLLQGHDFSYNVSTKSRIQEGQYYYYFFDKSKQPTYRNAQACGRGNVQVHDISERDYIVARENLSNCCCKFTVCKSDDVACTSDLDDVKRTSRLGRDFKLGTTKTRRYRGPRCSRRRRKNAVEDAVKLRVTDQEEYQAFLDSLSSKA